MSKDLDREDAVRELRVADERAKILESSPEFQWFLRLVENEIARAHARIERGGSERDMNTVVGEIKGFRRVIALLGSERHTIEAELGAMGARI